MRVIIQPSAAEVAKCAAGFVERLVRNHPDCVLGLATGSTPLGLYRELVSLHQEADLDFSKVTTFNLDEYVGLAADHPQSYRYFMETNLFRHINLDSQQTHVPPGLPPNPDAVTAQDFQRLAAKYEEAIQTAGGIDLQVLGIGTDGHIAFNEPGSSLGSRTRIKTLAEETLRDNARFFDSPEEVPRLAITMGVGTILESKMCMLLATGEHKAEAIAATVEGPITAQITASALQLHREVVVIVDEPAAGKLTRRSYYDQVERSQALLEEGKLFEK